MATSYLDLTNELLRELNEVPLTTGDFGQALGIQAYVKDCVNRAYFDIINEEPQWPFLSAPLPSSANYDPMLGNVTVQTEAGKRFYQLKIYSPTVKQDYSSIDWNTFYLTTEGVSGETAPYVSKNLRFTTTEEWKDYFRVSENADSADQAVGGEPARVIRSQDGRSFGLSPIPDKPYKVWFSAWVLPTKLSTSSDLIVFPEMYTSVLLAKARYYIWQFKDNPQSAAFALDDYKKGLDSMRSNLIEPTPSYFKDDRVRFI
jgi:hypothetical protein